MYFPGCHKIIKHFGYGKGNFTDNTRQFQENLMEFSRKTVNLAYVRGDFLTKHTPKTEVKEQTNRSNGV